MKIIGHVVIVFETFNKVLNKCIVVATSFVERLSIQFNSNVRLSIYRFGSKISKTGFEKCSRTILRASGKSLDINFFKYVKGGYFKSALKMTNFQNLFQHFLFSFFIVYLILNPNIYKTLQNLLFFHLNSV